MKLTSPVSDLEVILLEAFKPSSHLSFGIIHLNEESCKGCVIDSNQEFPSIQIFVEMFNSHDDRQQLLSCSIIVLLRFRKCTAEVFDDFFFFVLHL